MNKKYLGLLALGSVLLVSASVTSTLLPSGVGSYSAWTPSTGTTHYTLVDETSCNGTTDYVSTSLIGGRDSFAVSVASVPNGSVITGISIIPCASKDVNSGTANLSVFYRLNGTDSANSATYALSGKTPVTLATTTYSGLFVTKNASTTLETGVVRVSGTAGARVSRLATIITYSSIPNTPTNVRNTVSSSTNVLVQWNDTNSDEFGYFIEKSTDGINFSLIASTTPNATSYFDIGLATGTYSYRLRALNIAGYSGYSSTTVAVIP